MADGFSAPDKRRVMLLDSPTLGMGLLIHITLGK